MTAQTPEEILQEQNDDLVGYIQDYQQQVVELNFGLVQGRQRVRKLEAQLAHANERIAELERPAAEPAPLVAAEPPAKEPAKK